MAQQTQFCFHPLLILILWTNQGLYLIQLQPPSFNAQDTNTNCFRFLTPVPHLNITDSFQSVQKYTVLPCHVDLKIHLIHPDLSWSVSNVNDIQIFNTVLLLVVTHLTFLHLSILISETDLFFLDLLFRP